MVNIYMEVAKYMKRAVMMGCTNEEVLKRRAYMHALHILDGRNVDREMLKRIRRWTNCLIMIMREEVRQPGEPFERITLEVVRERMARK